MDITDIPDDAYAGDESPPDLSDLESPESLLTGGPIRERLLDSITGLRSPTKVSDIADLADCDTETARDYIEWFTEMGMVHRHEGRPVRYERNDAYFQWRRVEQLRSTHANEEIRETLTDIRDQLAAYRNRFDVERPADVSPEELDRNLSTEAMWEALAEWKTLQQRAERLDAACADDDTVSS